MTANPPRRNPAGVPYPIAKQIVDGFTVHVKDDGYDYVGLYRCILDGAAETKTLLYDDPEHYVYLVRENGRAFVFKRFGEFDGKFDTKVWRYFAGPFYSSLLRQVNVAVAAGCGSVPDMYLAAEKMEGGLARDNYVLLEFVPGTCMDRLPDVLPYRDAIRDAFIEMHRHNLSLGNIKAGNLVLTEEGAVRIIDLSVRGTQLTGRAKDAIKVKRLWGIDLPCTVWVDHLARIPVGIQLWIARTRKAIKRALRKKK